jgi:deoxyribodipyrimidine photo-lyase
MLEGLRDVQEALERRGIKMVVRKGSPDEVAIDAGKVASLVVTDRAYMLPQKKWREMVAGDAGCLLTQVESDVVVPVEFASDKQEYAARTLRPRIQEYLDDFLVGLTPTKISKQSLNMKAEGIDLSDIEKVLDGMDLDRSVGALSHLYRGGASEAKKVFRSFLKNRFDAYTGHRNQPQTDDVSHMSKYLHFGQISPIWLALEARKASTKKVNIEAFVEELVVRRELSMNFVLYSPDYDSYSNLPEWAKKTLEEHRDDDREHTYTRKQLESAETHDEY